MFQNIKQVTLARLKQHAVLIHYFGLGFIQIKLGDIHRIHFYNRELPAIVGDEDIHNHRYDFTSVIFHGIFEQEIFEMTRGNTHLFEDESCKEGSHCDTRAKPCGIRKIMTQRFAKGSSYFIAENVFHRVMATEAITFLAREKTSKQFAQVVRPKGASKVCPFSKKIAEADLWEIVEKMLVQAHKKA